MHQLTTLDTFFRYSEKTDSKLVANSILIDMEPKVIDSLLSRNSSRGWEYDSSNVVIKQEGSGNNWAYGFNHHGKQTAPEILKKIRKNIERIDCLDGLLVL